MPRGNRARAMTLDRAILSRTWWAIGPGYVLLTARLAVDRACRDPNNLVPALASRPVIAWVLAAVYVLAHVWLLLAYLQAAAAASSLAPLGAVGAIWRHEQWKVWVLTAAIAVEYAPLALFKAACG
jgi:hypothetical protein